MELLWLCINSICAKRERRSKWTTNYATIWEAFKVAEALASDFDVEVVQGSIFVAHIMKSSLAAKRQKFAA